MPSAAPSSPDAIAAFLQGVRRRLVRRRVWSAAATLALAAGAGLWLALVGEAIAPSGIWRALLLAGAAVAVGLEVVGVARLRGAFAGDEAVARFVGELERGLGSDLLSAVELGRELPRLEAQPVLSVALVAKLRANVAGRLGALDPAALVEQRSLRARSLRRLGAVAAAWAVLALAWPAGLRRGWAELGRARDERTSTSAEPIVGDLRLELEFPAYTGLAPRVIPGSSGQVLALPGTVVKIDARALVRAGDAAALVVSRDGAGSETVRAEVHGSALHASFTVRGPGEYRFVLGSSRRLREPEAHRIEIDPDRPPRVDLFVPADPLEVAGPRRIELAYSADDDYGLGDLELVWRVGEGAEARRVVVPGAQPVVRAASGKLEWDLGELDLKPGARVAYWLEAKDNDTVDKPNVGRSRVHYLTVYSPREKHEASVAAEEQLLEAAVTLLADRLELRRGDDGELADPLSPIHARAESLLVALSQAEQALDADKPSDARATLRDMHGRLGKLTRDEETALAEARKRRGKARTLEAGNARNVPELERDVIALDDLLGKQRLEELLQVGDEMAQARDRLKQLLAEYKKTRSEATRQEIEREMRELERKLAELREKASRLASELPDQFLNPDAMGKNDVGRELDKMRELLAKGDVDAAMRELDQMSSQLDKMMASMEGDLRSYRRERFTAEEKQLAELEDKISDLEHDEKQLHGDTEEIRQRARAEAQRLMRDKVEPFQKRARDKVAQLKKHLDQVDRPTLSPWEQEELGRIRQRVNDLDKMIEQGDLDEARGAARMADGALRSLGADVRDDEERAWRGARPGLKKTREHVDQGEQIARQLAEEMDQLMPSPDQLTSPEDARRLGDLAQRQQAARRRASELGQKLGELKKSAPPQMGESLRDAGQHMERAEGRLRGRDARDAEGEEQQALDKLSQMKQQLQEQRRPHEQMAGGRMDKEPVKIPGADEYKAPREFRQDLLEAMKRGAPPEYKDQVKRYYEELVK